MDEKKYNKEGYLIVSEMDTCPLWEKDTIPCRCGCNDRCFFCRFANFRTREFIKKAEEMPRGEPLYSVGIHSVIATTNKYEGMYDFSAEDGIFSAKISLNLK